MLSLADPIVSHLTESEKLIFSLKVYAEVELAGNIFLHEEDLMSKARWYHSTMDACRLREVCYSPRYMMMKQQS